MSTSTESGARHSFTRPRSPMILMSLGVFLLVATAVSIALWYWERQERATIEGSWQREAERVTAVYESLIRDPAAKNRPEFDPLAKNHQEMADLLGPGPRGRRPFERPTSPLLWAAAAYGGMGAVALASGLFGLRSRRLAPDSPARPADLRDQAQQLKND